MGHGHRQIGEVAERTGLSLRTIRYYEEVGLVSPASRSHGGFRLYAEADIARLELIKQMKPLDFTLEEMRDLLTTLDEIEDAAAGPGPQDALLERLEMYRLAAEERCVSLRRQLDQAQSFADSLSTELGRRSGARSSR
ncbi:MerR family transcriptional regulator [Actinotalea sp. BY-33]|uniref:MerR family transcriptional regulator n=1 Tax=Actinotalea soli TaxID=2819234 RepID=A0A939RTU9_9CELL|nr:MerR family transcriptional regulator [Actinotalea soli]MBO1750520.1 MerR family transcriptional regulator [Actinotalea soli]